MSALSALSADNEYACPFFYYPSPIDVEDLQNYADGSLFPVHLGDIFSSSRSNYQVLLKIGHGSFSTVWLAQDLNHNNQHVALKFLVAGARGNREVEILQWIQEHKHAHRGYQNTLRMLDNFIVGGPCPTYNVIVTDVLIPLRQLTWQTRERLLSTKQAFWQLFQGLAFLHSQDITHGDLYQGNLAIRVSIPTTRVTNDLLNTLGLPELVPVLASGPHKQDIFKRLPKYLVTGSLFRDYITEVIGLDALRSSDVELQIIDFSSSYRGLPPTPLPETFARVKAPEIFAAMSKLSSAVIKCGGIQSDVWSAACTMFEIACPGSVLFESYARPQALLKEVVRKIGPLPDSWQLAAINSVTTTSLDSANQYWEELLGKCNTFQ